MRAFLYCRVAHEDSFALEHQRFLLQLYAKQAGYTIIGAADEYGSGLTLDRPALQKVTEAVVAGKVDVVEYGANADVFGFYAGQNIVQSSDRYSMTDLVTRVLVTGKEDKNGNH